MLTETSFKWRQQYVMVNKINDFLSQNSQFCSNHPIMLKFHQFMVLTFAGITHSILDFWCWQKQQSKTKQNNNRKKMNKITIGKKLLDYFLLWKEFQLVTQINLQFTNKNTTDGMVSISDQCITPWSTMWRRFEFCSNHPILSTFHQFMVLTFTGITHSILDFWCWQKQ